MSSPCASRYLFLLGQESQPAHHLGLTAVQLSQYVLMILLSPSFEQGGRGDFGQKGASGAKGEKGEIVSTLSVPFPCPGPAFLPWAEVEEMHTDPAVLHVWALGRLGVIEPG